MRSTKMGTINSRVEDRYGNWTTLQLPADALWSPHITFGEIANPSSGEDIILELPYVARIHRDCWEIWRNWWGKKVPINSGYRTAKYNAKVGGVSNSLHRLCCAYDNAVGAVTDSVFKECYDVCYAIAEAHDTQCELGRYPWGLHIGFGKLDYTDKRVFVFDKR